MGMYGEVFSVDELCISASELRGCLTPAIVSFEEVTKGDGILI